MYQKWLSLRSKYRRKAYIVLSILLVLLFVTAQIWTSISDFLISSGAISYLILLLLLVAVWELFESFEEEPDL
jgi:polyferredoxin